MDTNSFAQLAQTRSGIYSALWRLQDADRQDLKQECILACIRAASCYNPNKGRVESYVRVIVDRAARQWFHSRRLVRKRNYRSQTQPSQVILEDLPEPPQSLDYSKSESLSLLRLFVEALPKLRRRKDRVLLIQMLMGVTGAELARRAGVSRQMISLQRRTVLKQLRALLADEADALAWEEKRRTGGGTRN
ncbi:MAG TPA: sigma-70 family RNA polymerase sigma factor [Gemmataceae bacterium]|nr:sigma-70 family RNA polymerase sigma factor [Gemmataceae bacterium]